MAHGPSGRIQAEPQPVAVPRVRHPRHDVGVEPRDDRPERNASAHPLVPELQLFARSQHGAGSGARLLPRRHVLPHLPAVLGRRLDLPLHPPHALDAAPPIQRQQVQRHAVARRRQQLQYPGVLPWHPDRCFNPIPTADTRHVLLPGLHCAHTCRPYHLNGTYIDAVHHHQVPVLLDLDHASQPARPAQLVDSQVRSEQPAAHAYYAEKVGGRFRILRAEGPLRPVVQATQQKFPDHEHPKGRQLTQCRLGHYGNAQGRAE